MKSICEPLTYGWRHKHSLHKADMEVNSKERSSHPRVLPCGPIQGKHHTSTDSILDKDLHCPWLVLGMSPQKWLYQRKLGKGRRRVALSLLPRGRKPRALNGTLCEWLLHIYAHRFKTSARWAGCSPS